MSNIHGIRDIDANNRTPFINRRAEDTPNPFVAYADSSISPREETFWYMIKTYLFGRVTYKSFGVIFSLFLVIMFVVQISIDGIEMELVRVAFLPVKWTGPVTSHLMNSFALVREEYEYYRLVGALIIHGEFLHTFGNVFTLIIYASIFEGLISQLKICLFFFATGTFTRNSRQSLPARL